MGIHLLCTECTEDHKTLHESEQLNEERREEWSFKNNKIQVQEGNLFCPLATIWTLSSASSSANNPRQRQIKTRMCSLTLSALIKDQQQQRKRREAQKRLAIYKSYLYLSCGAKVSADTPDQPGALPITIPRLRIEGIEMDSKAAGLSNLNPCPTFQFNSWPLAISLSLSLLPKNKSQNFHATTVLKKNVLLANTRNWHSQASVALLCVQQWYQRQGSCPTKQLASFWNFQFNLFIAAKSQYLHCPR